LLAWSFFTPPCHAAFVVTFSQDGPNVVATGSGSLNPAGLTVGDSGYHLNTFVNASHIDVSVGSPFSLDASLYFGLTVPTPFGPGGYFPASSGTVGIFGNELYLPTGYTSGTPLTGSATRDNTTISGLGLTPGTYTWTWGSGANADSLTVVIPSATALPEPSSLMLAGTALAVGGFHLRVRRRRAGAAVA